MSNPINFVQKHSALITTFSTGVAAAGGALIVGGVLAILIATGKFSPIQIQNTLIQSTLKNHQALYISGSGAVAAGFSLELIAAGGILCVLIQKRKNKAEKKIIDSQKYLTRTWIRLSERSKEEITSKADLQKIRQIQDGNWLQNGEWGTLTLSSTDLADLFPDLELDSVTCYIYKIDDDLRFCHMLSSKAEQDLRKQIDNKSTLLDLTATNAAALAALKTALILTPDRWLSFADQNCQWKACYNDDCTELGELRRVMPEDAEDM